MLFVLDVTELHHHRKSARQAQGGVEIQTPLNSVELMVVDGMSYKRVVQGLNVK